MDLYFLDKLENGLGDIFRIPLTAIILGTMARVVGHKNKQKISSYGHLFTLIFNCSDVDMADEKYKTASTMVNHYTISESAYF